jgi:glutamyl-tRNA reductase
MHWLMIGCSHHRTPLELRERLAFPSHQVSDALSKFSRHVPQAEAVLLSTCNRVEFYAAAATPDTLPTKDSVSQFLASYHGLVAGEIAPQLVELRNDEAIKHLFSVAASLDSMIVGEAQILSQVKQAYEIAKAGQYTGALTHSAFQRAAYVAKRVQNETTIHRRRISVPSVAVSEIASEFFERFDDKRIVLVGAGEMGSETLRYLVDAGAKHITVVNRNLERASELATAQSARVAPWSELELQLATADLIVSTTSATEPVVTLETFKGIWHKRSQRPLLILDLAVPRDFDPRIGELSEVYLYSVDDLQQVCDRNIELRRAEWPRAEKIIEEETKKFLSEMIHRGTGPTIQRLREQAGKTKQEELARLLSRLQAHGMDEYTEREVTQSFERLVNKLLHPPLQSLREQADQPHHATLLDSLRRLFNLDS